MKTITKKAFTLLFFVSFLVIACSSPTDTSNPETEEEKEPTPRSRTLAPEFSLTSLDGEVFTLSELRGKVVYIFFYGAGCPHCRINGPVTESQIYEEYKDNPRFVALGLDVWNQSSTANNGFKSVTGISYPLLLNARQTTIDYFGTATEFDRSVIIDSEGYIVYQGTQNVNIDIERVALLVLGELAKI